VTHSQDPEVLAARKRFAAILASLPEPKPHSGLDPAAPKTKAEKKAQRKKQQAG
jgi:hypothetical protein